MELKRDNKGRPVGLTWPEAPEFTEEQVKKSINASPNQLANLLVGRERQEYCGAGIHNMTEHGREIPTGGRYCNACKRERAREWRKNNPESVKQSKDKFNNKKAQGDGRE